MEHRALQLIEALNVLSLQGPTCPFGCRYALYAAVEEALLCINIGNFHASTVAAEKGGPHAFASLVKVQLDATV